MAKSSVESEREEILCLDFDGTLLEDPESWTEEGPKGRPTPGAQAFLQEMITQGYEVIICSARINEANDTGKVILGIVDWLERFHFPDGIVVVGTKPSASLYVDDRGWRFSGDWDEVRAALKLQPWWKNLTEKLQAVPPTLAEMLRRGAPQLFSCEDDEA